MIKVTKIETTKFISLERKIKYTFKRNNINRY